MSVHPSREWIVQKLRNLQKITIAPPESLFLQLGQDGRSILSNAASDAKETPTPLSGKRRFAKYSFDRSA
jgi:hypothetical protein